MKINLEKTNFKINVLPGSGAKKCKIHGKKIRCKSRPVFMVFNEDGENKLSRLNSFCCAKHLPLAVKKAHEENCQKEKEEKRICSQIAERLKGVKCHGY